MPPKTDWTTVTTDHAADALRGEHNSTLTQLERGTDVFGRPLPRSEAVAAEARRQLALRRSGVAAVHGLLRALDLGPWHATAGWHVTAYVTPDATVGLVDVARGVAVEARGVCLADDVIEALTIPEQSAGCLASGAAAWTAPDVGVAELASGGRMLAGKAVETAAVRDTGRRPSTPDGWRQLLCDLRGGDGVEPTADPDVILHTIGLRTCYGDAGRPARMIDERTASRWPGTAWWPLTRDQRHRCAALRQEWLDGEARRLDPTGSNHDVYPDQRERVPHGSDAATAIQQNDIMWWRAEAARSASRAALREAGHDAIRRLCDHDHDAAPSRVPGALTERLYRDLEPVCDALVPLLGEWPAEYDGAKPYHYSGRESITRALTAAATEIAHHLLDGMSERANAAIDAAQAILYETGPVAVGTPVR